MIITDGYANAAMPIDSGDDNNCISAINNENNKQSNVIKYISSMQEHSAVVNDEMNLNIGPGASASASMASTIPAIHVYPPIAVAAKSSAPIRQHVVNPYGNMMLFDTMPGHANTVPVPYNHNNRITMLSTEQKAPIEQVFYDLQSTADNNNIAALHSNVMQQPPSTATSTTSIYRNFDGARYATNPNALTGIMPSSAIIGTAQPHHQLMREFIMPTTTASVMHPIGYASGGGGGSGDVRAHNDIAVHQAHYQFNNQQSHVPAYNKPFGSNLEQISATTTIEAASGNSSLTGGRPRALRDLLFGNKHVELNDNAIVNELREKTEAFNNRLHEYAKFKEQLFGEHSTKSTAGLYDNAYMRRMYGSDNAAAAADDDDSNEHQLNKPEDEHKTSSMINLCNQITNDGVSSSSSYKPTMPITSAATAMSARLEDIPENDRVNENSDGGYEPYDIASMPASSRSAVDAGVVNKSSFTLNPALKNLISNNKNDSEVASKTPSTPHRTLAFDLSKNATYPFERDDEGAAYIEDVADDSRSEDSIEMMGKQIESLKLDETKKPEIAPRKLSLVDGGGSSSSRRSNLQADSNIPNATTGGVEQRTDTISR